MARTLVPRSQEMKVAAYYLARFSRDGLPPRQLNVSSWREAYARFFPIAGDGRSFQTFYASMEPIRKVFNLHFENGGPLHRDNQGEVRGPSHDLAMLAKELDSMPDERFERYVRNIFPDIDRGEPIAERLPASELRRVTPEQIDRAVARLLAGEDAPNFGSSTGYDLIAPDGTRLAPKKVFGLAIGEALGIDARPEHFSAGYDHPAFQLLEAAGYPVISKSDFGAQPADDAVDDDLALAEGSPRLRQHLSRERRPSLARAKRRAMLQERGHLECERCALVANTLGPHGEAVIEVHHAKIAVSDMVEGHVTRLADLQCLCANCHRIVHPEIAEASSYAGLEPHLT